MINTSCGSHFEITSLETHQSCWVCGRTGGHKTTNMGIYGYVWESKATITATAISQRKNSKCTKYIKSFPKREKPDQSAQFYTSYFNKTSISSEKYITMVNCMLCVHKTILITEIHMCSINNSMQNQLYSLFMK